MSSILKALKKLEHEKASHMPASLNIDSDILRTVDSSRNFSTSAFALMILLFFGGGAAVAYFFMKEVKVPLATTTFQSAITSQSPLPAPVVKPETPLSAEIIVVPARKETSGEALRQRYNAPDSGKHAESVTKKTDREPVSSMLLTPKKATGILHGELSAPTTPSLRVNGIAFQVNGTDNMAIINGTAVASGSTIEGVTVVEVRKDHVLFQYDGETFEIPLGQSNK